MRQERCHRRRPRTHGVHQIEGVPNPLPVLYFTPGPLPGFLQNAVQETAGLSEPGFLVFLRGSRDKPMSQSDSKTQQNVPCRCQYSWPSL